ncbi:DEAD/DEAH box helicase [Pseudahrensia aquimaris]|uniref:DEAD/DEAH box helicase n=1 Tax=Pseudahrensia aquimaris TaxID=744461 RepID=A0ABW3FGD2_9HYPH
MKFSDLGLSAKVLAAVEAAGYTEPTPIQAQAIPEVLARRDVMGIAQTGTGKTAAFTLPMISMCEKGRARARMPRTLILEPTRELAAQVEENFEKYAINHKLNIALLIGGVSFEDQVRKLDRGADVLIATPGRLLDLFERGRILMTGVEVLVIDEADRMLDMGFIPDIERIVKMVPFTRQTLFFSATMPPEIERLADQFLQNPVQVQVSAAASTSKNIEQMLVSAPKKDFEKREVLRGLIDNATNLNNGIIFCNRKRDVAALNLSLMKRNYSVGSLHGDMDQTARTKTLDGFRKGEIKLLVASDVAARGLDIPDVSHVFNYDVPNHAEDYVHRIGRCGRAGREGWAFTLVMPSDDKYLAGILKLTGDDIPWLDGKAASVDATEAPKRPRRAKKEDAPAKQAKDAETSEEKPKRAPRKRKEEATEPDQVDANVHQESAPRQPRKSESNERSTDRSRRNNRDKDDGGPTPQGLGDHVPAFMLTPATLQKD